MARVKIEELEAAAEADWDHQIPASFAGLTKRISPTQIHALLRDGVGAELDTLAKIAAALGGDPEFSATIATALGGKQASSEKLAALAALTSVANLTALANLVGAVRKGIRFTGAGTLELLGMDSGTWTPTCVGTLNTDSNPTAGLCRFIRMGNIVGVSGFMSVDPTAAGSTTFRFTTPTDHPSDFADAGGASGSISTGAAASSVGGALYSNAANNDLEISFRAGSGSSHTISFSGHYTVF